MAKGGPKQYPSLARYVELTSRHRPLDAPDVAEVLFITFGSLSLIVGLILLIVGLSTSTQGLMLGALIPGLITIGCGIGMAGVRRLMPRRQPPTALDVESRKVSLRLAVHFKDRRIHKAAPAAIITFLEEASRQYLRIQASLSTGFWRDAQLPPVYASLREKAKTASERSMQEILVLLSPRIANDTKPQHWKDVVEDIAENIGFKTPDAGFVYPGELEPVRQLASDLLSLANEVEAASIRALTEVPNVPNAGSELRSCLNELRSLNDAESELDSTLRSQI